MVPSMSVAVRRGLPSIAFLAAACVPIAADRPEAAPAGATGTHIAAADAKAAGAAMGAAAEQVRRCYRTPRIASAGKQISTRLRVRFAPDGTLAALPAVVAQSGVTAANLAYAGRMAEAASMAVVKCAPLRLPPESYQSGWREFDLTFSPRALA